MDIKEIGVNASHWIGSAQDRPYWRALVNATLNLHGDIIIIIVKVGTYTAAKT